MDTFTLFVIIINKLKRLDLDLDYIDRYMDTKIDT